MWAAKVTALGLAVALLAPFRPQRSPAPSPTPPAVDPLAGPHDGAYRQALDRLYDGDANGALDRLAELNRQAPDPIGAYLEALVLCWKLEQRTDTGLDKDFLKSVERARALAEARLQKEPADLRARFARGAAHGIESRYHLFRLHRRDAARAAVRMREDLMAVRKASPASPDALFGLGLYDYYADVLPRLVKVLRFFTGMPGGDRQRGLASIEAARTGSLLHGTEVEVQLYEIYAFYERKPDRALSEARALHRRYPGWPLWGLKLAEHLRDRMGLYAESAAVARELLHAAEAGDSRFTGVAAAMARASLGESLLLDLRIAEARAELLPVREVTAAPAVGARARLLLGRSLELEGDREGAAVHYRRAAETSDRELRRQAQEALATPLPPEQVRALQLVARARRLAEAGRAREATESYRLAWSAWPEAKEAALAVAEDELRKGHAAEAADLADGVAGDEEADPAWLVAWARLVLAQARDLSGHRQSALKLYQQVFDEPCGREELRARARDGLRRPFVAESPRASPASSR
jgi:hypothetical protein